MNTRSFTIVYGQKISGGKVEFLVEDFANVLLYLYDMIQFSILSNMNSAPSTRRKSLKRSLFFSEIDKARPAAQTRPVGKQNCLSGLNLKRENSTLCFESVQLGITALST